MLPMGRFARVVVSGIPYHVTHRGNRRDDVFYGAEDRARYCRWLREYSDLCGLEVWAYCLMSNHVHLLAVPRRDDALARSIGRTHMRHARHVNREQGWSGHLWANRFYSTALDEEHLWAAVRYVEGNPVRAGVVDRAEAYGWSSARAHARGEGDALLSAARPFPDAERVGGDWGAWLAQGLDAGRLDAIRKNTMTGRPTGDERFVARLERLLDRTLRPRKRGRKPKRAGKE